MNEKPHTEAEKKILEAKFKKFKERFFAGRNGFSGVELEDCKKQFLLKYGK